VVNGAAGGGRVEAGSLWKVVGENSSMSIGYTV